jgi:hypothetical protein
MYGTGLSFTRVAIAKAMAGGDRVLAEGFARKRWGRDAETIVQYIKAPVAGSEAATLANEPAMDFRAAAFPETLLGKLPGVRRVPTFRPMLTQTSRSTAQWIKHGQAIRPYAGGYTRDPGLRLKKVGSLFVCSKESIEDSGAEENIRVGLLTGCTVEMNRAFIDPANTGDDATPASVTSEATPIVMAGDTIDHLDNAFREALQALGPMVNMASVRVIMSAALAGCLALARGTGGAPAYPGLTAAGGMVAGLPALTFDGADNASSSDGEFIALVDGSAVSYTDEMPEVGLSLDALIELNTEPTGDSVTPTAASQTLVSMFQEEAVCFRGTWRANWLLRRPDAVQVITGVPFDLNASS